MGQLEEGGQERGLKNVGIDGGTRVFSIPELVKERDSGSREAKIEDTGRPSPRPKDPPERTQETSQGGEEASTPKRGSAAGESSKVSPGLSRERSGGKNGGKFAKSGSSGAREGASRVGGKVSEGGRSGKNGATNSSSGSKDGALRNGHGGASEGRSSTPEFPCSGQDGKSGEGIGKEGAQESKSGGSDGIDFDFGRWFSHSMHWPDQGRKLAAARTALLQTKERVQGFVEFSWPLVKKWSLLASRAMLVLGFLALECGIRGVTSLFRLGSAALFLLVWCTAFNLGILAGFFNFSVAFGLSLASGFFLGYTASFGLIGLFGAVVLWMFGSFWMTGAIVVLGGVLFVFDHARKAILVTMLYSIYSVKGHGGWLGLIMCAILAFISSDIVIYFLSINNSEGNQGSGQKEKSAGQAPEQGNSKSGGSHNSSGKSRRTAGSGGPTAASGQGPYPGNSSTPFPEAVPNNEDVRSSGGASTSATSEGGDPISAEEEVARVLSSSDHYAVLGFARYDNFDVAVLKREYRKLAMLVHPDKNRGNGKAEEAFKRLQNAYEVLLDTIKRKVYDDELRREEVLANFRQHRQGSHQAGRCQSPNCGCHHSEDEAEDDVPADSRRIACKKCNESHVWIATDRSKLRARWCLECQDYHQAKDGDGWVEQSGQPFFFGMFQKVDVPRAFACAEGKVYDVTEWVICQGMKCPPNTHKPTFHVSTAGAGKSVPRGPNRAARGGGRGNPAEGFPFPDIDENMTEHEFFDWLETAMASGMFGDLGGVPGYPGGRGAPPKGTKPSRKKRKGKKQW